MKTIIIIAIVVIFVIVIGVALFARAVRRSPSIIHSPEQEELLKQEMLSKGQKK